MTNKKPARYGVRYPNGNMSIQSTLEKAMEEHSRTDHNTVVEEWVDGRWCKCERAIDTELPVGLTNP